MGGYDSSPEIAVPILIKIVRLLCLKALYKLPLETFQASQSGVGISEAAVNNRNGIRSCIIGQVFCSVGGSGCLAVGVVKSSPLPSAAH